MEYFREMRELVGHRPLHLVGSGVLLYRDGKILLQKRSDDGSYGKHGGIVNIEENTEDAVRREVLEEIGVTLGNIRLFGVYSGPEMTVTYANGDICNFVDVVYISDDFSGEGIADGVEVDGLAWFDFDDVPDNLHPTDRQPILDFIAYMLKDRPC
ncbi:MAG: NUDIX hydrolase [Eubacteriales bacterium]